MEFKWKNSRLDPRPEHEARVLIANVGIYHMAVYDATFEQFTTTLEGEPLVIAASSTALYWTEAE